MKELKLFYFLQKRKGSISIFLTLIMLPMFVCAGLIIDGARISVAKTTVAGAGDLSMNAGLSEYDKVLKDVYGLFAMSDSTEDLQKNVSMYFKNTINNTGMLQGSDSYTRSFINSIGSMFSTDGIKFDNIVDTQADNNSFSLVTIPQSAMANPLVMKRQIIEYMKYRGPVNLAKGLLTKFGCFGNLSQQSTAMENKVNYDQKLSSVGDACKDAYENINKFKKLVGDTSYSPDNIVGTINGDIAKAKSAYSSMTEYILAANAPDFSVDSVSTDSAAQKDLDEQIQKIQESYEKAAEAKAKSQSSSSGSSGESEEDPDSETKSILGTINSKLHSYSYSSYYSELEKNPQDLRSQISYVQTMQKALKTYNAVNTCLGMYFSYYSSLSEKGQKSYENEYKSLQKLSNDIQAQSSRASGMQQTWKNLATSSGQSGSKIITDLDDYMDKIIKSLGDSIDSLNDVLNKIDELQKAGIDWKKSIDGLDSGDIKTSMQGDYKNSAQDIKTEDVKNLIALLTNNKKFFTGVKDRLEKIEYFGNLVSDEEYSATDYYLRFSSNVGSAKMSSYSNVTSKASQLMSANYKDQNVSGIDPPTYTAIDGKQQKQEFYKFLTKLCNVAKGTSSKKSDSENLKKSLNNAANNTSGTTASTDGVKTGAVSSAVNSEIQAAIDKLAAGSNFSRTSYTPGKMDDNDSKSADANKSNMTSIGNLLSGLTNMAKGFATTQRDNIYLEEYMSEMFSCYTSIYDPSDASSTTTVKQITPVSMNNKDMSKNALFRSEAEYILWGDDKPQDNLNKTKALIFGIRFALNSLFAFTNGTVQDPAFKAATAIAGWTGFGIPIVQAVITLAWSAAESVVDVTNLCAGKAVPVFKSKDTWVLGYNSLTTKLKDEATKVVSYGIDDIFDKINNAVDDKVDNLSGDITNYVDNTTMGAVEAAKSAILAPIRQCAMNIIGDANDLTKERIGQKVDDCLNDLKASIGGEADGASKSAKVAAIAQIQSSLRDDLVNTIYDCYEKVQDQKESTVDQVTQTISNKIDSIGVAIQGSITNTIKAAGDKLKSEVHSITSKAGEGVKQKAIDCISDYTEKVSGKALVSTKEDKIDKTTATSGITMTYKEYVKAFMFLFLFAGGDSAKNVMLCRTAKLIQANVAQQNSSFNIAKAYTMIEVKANISVRTTFFSVPVNVGQNTDGSTSYTLDYGNIGSGRQKVSYIGINGY